MALLFCHRNHTIQCMWKWPAPSHAGKAYDWFQCCNCLGCSETVSDYPDVRTWQSTFFCCLITFYYNCGDSPLFFECGKFFVFYPILRLCPVLWEFRCFQVIAFSKQETEIIELLNFNFNFGNLFNSNEIKIIILNCFDCFLIFKILGKYHNSDQ